jgi:hypothetical protein
MMDKEKDKSQSLNKVPNQNAEKKPNEHGGFYFSSHLKITDPNTKEIMVEKRGDT